MVTGVIKKKVWIYVPMLAYKWKHIQSFRWVNGWLKLKGRTTDFDKVAEC